MAGEKDAVKRVFELDAMERQWIMKALDTQHRVLRRSAAAEMDGSEIKILRQKELSAVSKLLAKFD